jgi:lipopolysaccharide transport system ATP-binding protein
MTSPPSSEPAVRLRDVSKVYRLYGRPSDRLVEFLFRRPRGRELRALDGVSLEVPKGSVLGLIGENGAGKSTLLKLVAGVSEPTSGSVEVRGTVASILELGAGFHGEFSGRENARLNAAILGVPPSRIAETLARTHDFSELGSFFDQPVRTYSSGMLMRLAFTIATEVDPEVLIIDEALAVGDGHFQKKSVDRIVDFCRRGKTILFCSHAMYFVTTLCQRAIWLAGGRLALEGEAPDVVREYESFLLEKNPKDRPADAPDSRFPERREATGTPSGGEEAREARIESVRLLDGTGGERESFRPGEELRIEVRVECLRPETALHMRVGIDRADGVQLFASDSRRDGAGPWSGSRRHRLTLRLPRFAVRSGDFSVFVYVGDEHALHLYDHVLLRDRLRIRPEGEFDVGIVELDREWSGEAGR